MGVGELAGLEVDPFRGGFSDGLLVRIVAGVSNDLREVLQDGRRTVAELKLGGNELLIGVALIPRLHQPKTGSLEVVVHLDQRIVCP